MTIRANAPRTPWKRSGGHRPALLAALLLAGGCALFPPAGNVKLPPPPRHEGELQPFRYASPDGLPIEGYMALPAGASAPAKSPCLLFLHGQIGFWRSYRPYALQLARLGYGVLYINYYSARMVNLKEGMRPFPERVERFHFLLEDMARGVDTLAAHPRCEGGGVTLVGFSLGGSYAFQVAARRPGKVAGIVSFYGGYRFRPLMDTWDIRLSYYFADEDGRLWHQWFARQDPQALIGKVRSPVLLLHGRRDAWIPYQQAREYHGALRERNIPADLVLLPRANHDFMFSLDPSPGQQAVSYLVEFLERRVVAALRRGCSPGGYGALPPCPEPVPLHTVGRPEKLAAPLLTPAGSHPRR